MKSVDFATHQVSHLDLIGIIDDELVTAHVATRVADLLS
jgi:hypothetical protein